jgi:hypothetical protein
MKIFVVLMLLQSCSSPMRFQHANRVAGPLSRPKEDTDAQLFFLRDTGISVALCGVDIEVDQKKVGTLASGEYLHLYVKPGRHLIKLRDRCEGFESLKDVDLTSRGRRRFKILSDKREGLFLQDAGD